MIVIGRSINLPRPTAADYGLVSVFEQPLLNPTVTEYGPENAVFLKENNSVSRPPAISRLPAAPVQPMLVGNTTPDVVVLPLNSSRPPSVISSRSPFSLAPEGQLICIEEMVIEPPVLLVIPNDMVVPDTPMVP